MRQILFVLFIVLFVSLVFGVIPNPTPSTFYQKDGSKIQVIRCGNEWNQWFETMDGYAIERGSDGWWVYAGTAPGSGGKGLKVGIDDPGLLPPTYFNRLGQEVPESARHPLGLPKANPFSNYRVLVLLVEFSDQPSLGTRAGDWADMMFHAPGNNVADYYREISYSQFSITAAAESHGSSDDGVVGWLTLERPHPGTGDHTGMANRQLTRDAIVAADPYVDFSTFDADGDGYISSSELGIIVVVAGYESSYSHYTPGVWSHQGSLENVPAPGCDGVKIGAWKGPGDTRTGGYIQVGEWLRSDSEDGHMSPIGIIAHELGHLAFDLPDVDKNAENEGGRHTFAGEPGATLMGVGCWGETYSGSCAGRNPAHMDSRFKARCGFVNPEAAMKPVEIRNDLNVPFSTLCWNDDHTPPPHIHDSSLLKCWSYAVIKSFKLKYPGQFNDCDPTEGTDINTISSTYFTSNDFSVGSAAYRDIVGTGGSGISHVAVIVAVYYPASLSSIIITDANRFGIGKILSNDSLQKMLNERSEIATRLYTPKDLTFPLSNSPVLQSPASASRFIGTSRTLSWSGSGFTSYNLWVDTNSSFSSPDQYNQSSTSKTISCTAGYVYYWKVRGYNGCYYGPFSPTWYFSIKTLPTTGMSVDRHGPYTEVRNTVWKISVEFTDANLDDLDHIKVYKKINSGSWQYVTTIQESQLPYTYNGPEITMVDGLPVKSGPVVYYEGRYYNSSGQYIAGQIYSYFFDIW